MCKLKYFLKSDQENARLVISTLSLGTYWLSWLTLKKLKLEFFSKGAIFVSLQLRQDFYNLHPWMKLNAFPFFFPLRFQNGKLCVKKVTIRLRKRHSSKDAPTSKARGQTLISNLTTGSYPALFCIKYSQEIPPFKVFLSEIKGQKHVRNHFGLQGVPLRVDLASIKAFSWACFW